MGRAGVFRYLKPETRLSKAELAASRGNGFLQLASVGIRLLGRAGKSLVRKKRKVCWACCKCRDRVSVSLACCVVILSPSVFHACQCPGRRCLRACLREAICLPPILLHASKPSTGCAKIFMLLKAEEQHDRFQSLLPSHQAMPVIGIVLSSNVQVQSLSEAERWQVIQIRINVTTSRNLTSRQDTGLSPVGADAAALPMKHRRSGLKHHCLRQTSSNPLHRDDLVTEVHRENL